MGVGVRRSGGRQRVKMRLALFAIVLVGSMILYTSHNHFSWLYHNDESSKVAQVLSGQRNFNHPPLLLTLADGVGTLVGSGNDPQKTVQVGRALSAIYLSLANALLVDLAVVYGGAITGAALALVLLIQPELFEVGHYFKEDTLLLFGLASSFWTLAAYGARTTCLRGALLGIALAVLASSKYVGGLWVVLIGAQATAWGWRRDRLSLVGLLWVFVLLTALFYLPALRFAGEWLRAGSLEMKLLLAGDYGTGQAVPHGLYWHALAAEFTWPILLVGAASFLAAGHERRPPGSWLMLGSSLLVLVALMWTAKFSDRYLLPVSLLMSFVVVTGPVLLLARCFAMDLNRERFGVPPFGAVVVATVLIFLTAHSWSDRANAFRSDARTELQQWIASHFHGDLYLAEDEMARVEIAPPQGKWTVAWFVADLGTLDELQREGVTHVLVSYDVCHRFVDGSVPQFNRDDFVRRQKFYQRLFREGTVVWSESSRDPKASHPGLTLVDIRTLRQTFGSGFTPH